LLKTVALNNKNPDKALDRVTKSFLIERAVFIRGAVRQAGAYPITKETTLENIIAVAGGTSLEANTSNIEVTSRESGRQTINLSSNKAKKLIINPGDTIRVNQKFNKITDQSVKIIGEVNNPGQYDLVAGDTLLSLINRAGGMTEQGYPAGALFSRAMERKREERRYQAQAQDLQMKLASSLQQTTKDKKPDQTQIQASENLITQLKHAKAVGRITVEANPILLNETPELDILLESGDKIFIPKRPLTVRVAGEVLSPASLQFRQGKDPIDYIREAGGTTYYADKGRAFVIYPNGSAQPLKVSSWNHSTSLIPPGSTIIVPRDPKPFDFLESAERVSQILANLAISGLYVEAIGDD
jgi:protein involved in polysaccharide export with SLBB domain